MAEPLTFDQLLTFARDNDVSLLKELLRMGCPPSFSNRVGQTALHVAATWGSIDAVRVLLEALANPNAQNKLRGSTPLHAAAMGRGPAEKRADCANLMIQFKGDPGKPDNHQESPLNCAKEEVVWIALGGASLVLHKAVQTYSRLSGPSKMELHALFKSLEDALQCIHSGACGDLTVNSINAKGDTALHMAVESTWREGVELLLKAHADPSIPNFAHRAPLHTAAITGDNLILQALLDAKADATAIDRDPDHEPQFSSTTFKETPDMHRSPLHYAAELGNVIAIDKLLAARADVNAGDSQNQSSLHLCLDLRTDPTLGIGTGVRVAALPERPELNDRLGTILGPAASPVNDDGNARYPVLLEGEQHEMALESINLASLAEETLDRLLGARADVNAGNHKIGETRTVLHVAARIGDATLVRKVLVARAYLEQMDSKLGFSALHLAARGKHLHIVKLLLAANAQLGQTASNGKTAAELAKSNGACAELVALLSGTTTSAVHVESPGRTYADFAEEERAALYID